MPDNLAITIESLDQIAVPSAIFVGVLIAGYVIRKILFMRLNRWAQNTQSQLDDIIIVSTKGPFVIWFLMLGAYLAAEFSTLPR